MKTRIAAFLLITFLATTAWAETVEATKKAPRQRWHAPTVALQVGAGVLIGTLSFAPYLGIGEFADVNIIKDPEADTYTSEGLAVGAAIVPVLAPAAVWLTGKLMRGTGSPLWTILLGWAAGAAVGVPATLAAGDFGSGWLAGEIAALAVSVPVYHLTSDAPGDSQTQLFIGKGPGMGLVIGGRF